MLDQLLTRWELNKDKLKHSIMNDSAITTCDYKYLVKKTVEVIFGEDWDSNRISEIGGGNRRGTFVYLIPKNIPSPSQFDYIVTYIDYGRGEGEFGDRLEKLQHGTQEFTQIPDNWWLVGYLEICFEIVCNADDLYYSPENYTNVFQVDSI